VRWVPLGLGGQVKVCWVELDYGGLRRLRLGWMRHGELCYGEAVKLR